jgi:very-short-patch-repair endonuclease
MDGSAVIARIAARQLGVFTRTQAYEAGLSRHQLLRAVRAGELVRPFPSVFASAATAPTWERSAMAALLAGGPDAVLSHRSALAVHRLDGVTPPVAPIEISVPSGQCPRVGGVIVHRVILPASHVTAVGSLRVTTPARTVADVTGIRSGPRLGRVIDEVLVGGLATQEQLDDVVEVLESCRGRRLARMRAVLAIRGREMRRAESPPEGRLYRVIVGAGLPIPVQQHRVRVAGEHFRIDLAYPDHRLGLEYLGFDPHRTRAAFDRDFRRDRLLTVAGWEILYFTSADSDAEIVRAVRSCISQR